VRFIGPAFYVINHFKGSLKFMILKNNTKISVFQVFLGSYFKFLQIFSDFQYYRILQNS